MKEIENIFTPHLHALYYTIHITESAATVLGWNYKLGEKQGWELEI